MGKKQPPPPPAKPLGGVNWTLIRITQRAELERLFTSLYIDFAGAHSLGGIQAFGNRLDELGEMLSTSVMDEEAED